MRAAVAILAFGVLAVAVLAQQRPAEGFDGVPPAYVISLPDGRRPRYRVADQLAAHGQGAEFVDAVDGRRLGRAGGDTCFDTGIHDWNPGQMGCALSHVQMWARVAAGGEPYSVVFEDDVLLQPGWREGLGAVLDEVRDQDVDVVYLGHCFETEGAPWKGSTRLRHSVNPACTHAYLLTRQGARALSAWAAGTRFRMPIDNEMADLCATGRLTCLSAYPTLATQSPGEPSQINDTRHV